MVKYENSKIYKIVDNTNGNIYIGSTVKTLSQRLGQHRAAYKQYLNGKCRNCKSFEIIANGDYDIVLLEECKIITNKDELHARERHYIDNFECVNKYRPGVYNELGKEQYKKQYREANKELIKQYEKEYYDANKVEIKQQKKEYYKEKQLYFSERLNCPHCGISFRRDNKTQHQRSKTHQNNINNQPNTE